MLETRDLTKNFGEFTAVDEVDFTVDRGVLKAIIGPNGAGKTTFFNMLSGAFPPSSGEILVDGRDVTGKSAFEMAREGISRSFQITNLFEGLTVIENIRLGIQTDADIGSRRFLLADIDEMDGLNDAAHDVAERVDLEHAANKKVSSLSHGDKRKLEVGMTISNDAELLLFDEPTAGLTTEETRELIDIIRSLGTDRTIVLIEHDMEFVRDLAQEIAVFHQGKIIADDIPEAVQNDEHVRSVYLGEETVHA